MIPNKKAFHIFLVTGTILLLPLSAMQFTSQVAWDIMDFAVAAALLIGAGLTYELSAKKLENGALRIVVGVVVLVALILVWAHLSIGIIGG